HPDKHPPSSRPEAEARFKAISEAYEALLDQQENRGAHGEDAQRRVLHEERARHTGEGVQEGVQLRRPRRAPRLRRVLQLHRAQGAAAGAQARVHPRGALPRLQEGGQLHPRRRHQERVNREEGGDTDGGGEARVEEREAGGAGRHGGRAAGVPARRRHPHGVREEAPGVQAGGRRPGAQGGGAAGGRAHRLVLLVPPPRRQEGELLVPGRGRPPRLREGDRRRGHAGPRAEGRARRPEGQVGRRLPQGAHPRAARRPRRDPQRVLLIHRPQFQAYQVFLAVSVC
ncbi:HSP40/DnaJ peptide-binding protein, partial [Zea mays]